MVHRFIPNPIVPLRCKECGCFALNTIHLIMPAAVPRRSYQDFTPKDLNFLKLVSQGLSYETWIEINRRAR